MISSQNIWRPEDVYTTIDRIQRAKDVPFAHKACEGTELYSRNTK
jgi:hypothetical protein